MKRCQRCKEQKDTAQFCRRRTEADGLDPTCRDCKKAAKVAFRAKFSDDEWAEWSKAQNRKHNLRRFYRMTVDEYDAKLAEQGGVCAVCASPPGRVRLAVDHEHRTNQVRGLLCELCNRSLGLMRDDPVLLRAAADYIEAHR